MREVKSPHVRRRTQPLKGYHSALLLRPGGRIDLLPAGSLLVKTQDGFWEAHIPIANKKITKKLAELLDAVAFL